MKPLILACLLLALAVPAAAQGPVNPSVLTWTAPTTNADASPLSDLAGYNLRVAGPLPSATCPAFSAATYPVKKVVASTTTTPAPNTTLTFGTAGSGNLAGDLGLTVDGQYCVGVTAFDNAPTQVPPGPVANESGVILPLPFARRSVDRIAPSAPPGVGVSL